MSMGHVPAIGMADARRRDDKLTACMAAAKCYDTTHSGALLKTKKTLYRHNRIEAKKTNIYAVMGQWEGMRSMIQENKQPRNPLGICNSLPESSTSRKGGDSLTLRFGHIFAIHRFCSESPIMPFLKVLHLDLMVGNAKAPRHTIVPHHGDKSRHFVPIHVHNLCIPVALPTVLINHLHVGFGAHGSTTESAPCSSAHLVVVQLEAHFVVNRTARRTTTHDLVLRLRLPCSLRALGTDFRPDGHLGHVFDAVGSIVRVLMLGLLFLFEAPINVGKGIDVVILQLASPDRDAPVFAQLFELGHLQILVVFSATFRAVSNSFGTVGVLTVFATLEAVV